MKLPPSRGGRKPTPERLKAIQAAVYRANRDIARNILNQPEVWPKESGMARWARLIIDKGERNEV